ncbi:MAG: hypothetical protein Tsb0013_20100 [Phycisphaerales bacterium]
MNWADTVALVCWGVLGTGAVLALVAIVAEMRRRACVPVCSRCGYDLSGQTLHGSERCPECGCDLEEWGVLGAPEHGRVRGRGEADTHRVVRATRWWITLWSLASVVCVVLAAPPFAMVHHERTVLTVARVPAGMGTVTVEENKRWVDDTGAMIGRSDFYHAGESLERTHIATSGVPGARALDLSDPALTYEDALAWVQGLDPSVPVREAERLALLLYSHAPGYAALIEAREHEFDWYWAKRSGQPYAGVAVFINGVTYHTGTIGAMLRSGLGRPSFEHARAVHWWRLAGLVALLVVIAAVHVGLPRWYRIWTRSRYRRWRRWLEQGC